ncbi:hypothetical protein FRC12_013982 [Ceratobasidium sp. 428]|nr:hypothetical protein FRC12_013982 [Ceratobasidium sp. 428]
MGGLGKCRAVVKPVDPHYSAKGGLYAEIQLPRLMLAANYVLSREPRLSTPAFIAGCPRWPSTASCLDDGLGRHNWLVSAWIVVCGTPSSMAIRKLADRVWAELRDGFGVRAPLDLPTGDLPWLLR